MFAQKYVLLLWAVFLLVLSSGSVTEADDVGAAGVNACDSAAVEEVSIA